MQHRPVSYKFMSRDMPPRFALSLSFSRASDVPGKGEMHYARSAEETDRHFLLVSLVIIYAVFATIIAVAHLAESSAWVHLLYFFVTGILWVLPAMGIIWWMAQPPRKKQH